MMDEEKFDAIIPELTPPSSPKLKASEMRATMHRFKREIKMGPTKADFFNR